MKDKKLGIYIHIPFCVKKCNYCDFNSFSCDENIKKDYIRALCKEISMASEDYKDYIADTVFIGGGTPSILPADLTEMFMDTLFESFNIDSNAEISMEANPGTLDLSKALAYKKTGINRISLGLQSTVDEELKVLGRIHNYSDFLKSYDYLREAGFKNINVDLMNGIPGQTYDSFTEGLERVKELRPEHISIYSLIIEEGTPFYGQNLDLPDEDTERRMVHSIKDILGSYYNQYEISNYARKGFECRHNIKYWRRDEYLGLGLSAASLINETRFKNTDDIKEYLNSSDNKIRIAESEKLSIKDQMSEYAFLGLRMNEGICISDFEKTFNASLNEIYGRQINKHIDEGLLEIKEDRLFLTAKGRDLANYVWSDFIGD